MPSLSTNPTTHQDFSSLFATSGFINEAFQGFPVGGITHIFGSAGSGKSTLAMEALIHMAKQELGSFIIDCDRSYSPRRLLQLAMGSSKITDRLTVFHPRTFQEQSELITKLNLFLDPTIRLIIIDPITGLYRRRLTPKNAITLYRELTEYQLPRLLGLAQQHHLIILAINQVSSWEGKNRPVGGDAISRYAAMEIQLKRIDAPSPTCRLMIIKHRNQITTQHIIAELGQTGFQLLSKENPKKS